MTAPGSSPYPPRKPLWKCANPKCGKGNGDDRSRCISCGTPRPS